MSEAAETLLGECTVDFVSRVRTQPPADKTVMNLDDLKIQMNVLKTHDENYLMLVDLNAAAKDKQQIERQQQEIQALQSELKKERERLMAKINLTATIAHEFGNPISAIRMKTHILQNHLDQLSEQKIAQYLDRIDFQLNYLVDLLHDLMLVNRINPPEGVADVTPYHLGAFCQKILTELSLRSEGCDLVMTTQGQLDLVQLDPRLIRYMLRNLVGNALKYSPEGCEVRLDIDGGENAITFSVSDHGIGIPEQELPHIFAEHYRASNAGHFDGTGLGLAVVKACVEMCGGTIAVESKLGEGTTFVVSLPRKSD